MWTNFACTKLTNSHVLAVACVFCIASTYLYRSVSPASKVRPCEVKRAKYHDNPLLITGECLNNSHSIQLKTKPSDEVADTIRLKLNKYRDLSNYDNYFKRHAKPSYISAVNLRSRLGNQMFQTASVIGIAMQNDLLPAYNNLNCFMPNRLVERYFKESLHVDKWIKFKEHNGLSYDNRVHDLSQTHRGKHIRISSLFQSYRYFDNISDSIRSVFTLNDISQRRAVAFFQLIDTHKLLNSVWVGVHIRRGDITHERYVRAGRMTPNDTYFKKAMDHFKHKFGKEIIFIVCGNDPHWNSKYIKALHTNVIISRHNNACVDLAILSACDHVIMSVGTFSWWAGYLSCGEVVYYENYFRSGSRLDSLLNKSDFFLRHWIGMH